MITGTCPVASFRVNRSQTAVRLSAAAGPSPTSPTSHAAITLGSPRPVRQLPLYWHMAFITMWRRGVRECMLVDGDKNVIVRMIDDTSILREETATSVASALRTAQIWEIEERRAAPHTIVAA